MIFYERFGPNEALAHRAIELASSVASGLSERSARFELCGRVEPRLLERIESIEWEIYEEDIAYEIHHLREFLEQVDAMLLLLHIDDELEGYAFGYRDNPEVPLVQGADYFIDDGVVTREWEQRGIGTVGSTLFCLLVYLLGYRSVGLMTEECDREGRALVDWYRRLGFEDAHTDVSDDWAMRLRLDEAWVDAVLDRLPIDPCGDFAMSMRRAAPIELVGGEDAAT